MKITRRQLKYLIESYQGLIGGPETEGNEKAIFVFDELDRMGVEYDQIALVDSSFMIRWDAPNFFDLTDHRFTAFRDTDNLKWVYDSIKGYESFFDFKLDNSKYVNSGVIIFNQNIQIITKFLVFFPP